jgi:hypothetical protein
MKEHKISRKQRILIVMKYLYLRGANKESVNNVYRKIISTPKQDLLYDEQKSNDRIKVIGQNGNTGLHYD